LCSAWTRLLRLAPPPSSARAILAAAARHGRQAPPHHGQPALLQLFLFRLLRCTRLDSKIEVGLVVLPLPYWTWRDMTSPRVHAAVIAINAGHATPPRICLNQGAHHTWGELLVLTTPLILALPCRGVRNAVVLPC
jgi:hypothetical protein